MPTSAAGNKTDPERRPSCRAVTRQPCPWPRRHRVPAAGFTLIELMVVVALIAVATAGAALSLRDSARSALERDAQRLAAVLESARAQARASDAPVVWQAQEGGFVLRGLPKVQSAQSWLSPDTRSRVAAPVRLGPEPLIPPQQIELYAASRPQHRLWVVSDGLRPFAVQRVGLDRP